MNANMTSISESKKNILISHGYKYHFDRMIYYNGDTKKIFSNIVISDNDEQWLIAAINELNGNQWIFYFYNPLPSETLKKEIINALNE